MRTVWENVDWLYLSSELFAPYFAEDPIRCEKSWKSAKEKDLLSDPWEPCDPTKAKARVDAEWPTIQEDIVAYIRQQEQRVRFIRARARPYQVIVRGKWASSFDALEVAIHEFVIHESRAFGAKGFHFEVLPDPTISAPTNRIWMFWARNPTAEPDGPWPYADVYAREAPGGLVVQLRRNDAEVDATEPYLEHLLGALAGDGLQVEGKTELPRGKRKRPHGPAPSTLTDCKKAMVDWLDNGKSLTTAAQLAGRDRKTIRDNIPRVLEMVDAETRERWLVLLRAVNQNRDLGEIGEN